MTDQPEKMDLTSMDVAAEKKAQLKQLFPEAFTEDKIDFDQLQRALGEWIEPGKERYGLTWPGKAECMKVIQAPSIATLKPDIGESVDFDTTENIFIEGDNLEVLKLLQKSYFGKIKMIYIDPPYNTGNEFIYPDKFAENLDTYLSYTGQIDNHGNKFSTNTDSGGRYHANWLNMMFPRLYLARNLLSDDGIIFISIDDHEISNIKMLMNDIFGKNNFISSVVLESNPRGRQSELIATSHEYVLIYAKNADMAEFYGEQLRPDQLSDYKHKDENGLIYRLRGLRHRGNESLRSDRPEMYFPLYVNPSDRTVSITKTPSHSIEVFPLKPDGVEGRWEWGKSTAKERIKRLEGVKGTRNDKWDIHQREYLENDDGEQRTAKWKTLWYEKEINYQNGKNELKEYFGTSPMDFPKPKYLLEKLISGTLKSGDLILDFFAGSCTTADAAFAFSCSAPVSWICIQLPEKCEDDSEAKKAGFSTIADIGKERIRRAGQKIRDERVGRLDLEGGGKLDLGFKVFKLTKSNFRLWEGDVEKIGDLTAALEAHINHVDPTASPEDILYELLLKAGFELTAPVKKQSNIGEHIYSIADGALLICLDKNITPELIDALADADPIQVICLDEGFKGNDQLKTNAVQTFKSRTREGEEPIVFRTV